MCPEPIFSSNDTLYMSRALELAKKGLYTCAPNPRVGCVIVRDEEIAGEGWHYKAGEAHAEVHALQQAGDRAKGSSVYVTLEPCSHYGKTPPCAHALIKAGVAEVFIGMTDPNPKVAGSGIEALERAGIRVRSGLLEKEVRALNSGFVRRMQTGLPLVRSKIAMSFDGRTAMSSGESKWITGTESRQDVQKLRARSCAIVTGLGTILADDPSLTFRLEDSGLNAGDVIPERQPLRVIADSRLETPPESGILALPGRIIIACGALPEGKRKDFFSRVTEIKKSEAQYNKKAVENHIEVVELPGPDGKVDLAALLRFLGERECNEVLLESGATLSGAAVRQGLVDELYIYIAPVLLGSSARPMLSLPFEHMREKLDIHIRECCKTGNDWRVIATLENPESRASSPGVGK